MTTFAIAGLQLEIGPGNNLDQIVGEVRGVKRLFPWVDMVLVGELAAHGPATDMAEPLPGPTEAAFADAAREAGVWLVPGTLYERSDERVFNTAPVIDPEGKVVARYRKMYPFLPYESGVDGGTRFVVFDVPEVGRFGVSICYDMWFPETMRTLVWMGAEVILHPSLTSSIDREAEHCMARACGATNQCYVFDVNVAGPLGVGESIIAGPGGEIIHQAGKGREIIPLRLDLDYVRDVRENGWHGLGQSLKSFRDSAVQFPQYTDGHASETLQALGPIAMAASDKRGSKC